MDPRTSFLRLRERELRLRKRESDASAFVSTELAKMRRDCDARVKAAMLDALEIERASEARHSEAIASLTSRLMEYSRGNAPVGELKSPRIIDRELHKDHDNESSMRKMVVSEAAVIREIDEAVDLAVREMVKRNQEEMRHAISRITKLHDAKLVHASETIADLRGKVSHLSGRVHTLQEENASLIDAMEKRDRLDAIMNDVFVHASGTPSRHVHASGTPSRRRGRDIAADSDLADPPVQSTNVVVNDDVSDDETSNEVSTLSPPTLKNFLQSVFGDARR